MRTLARLVAIGLGVWAALACGGAGGGGGPGWACESQGVWAECGNAGNGYERCTERVANGMGVQVGRGDAEYEALSMCTNHMLSAVAIANINGRGEIRRSCAITRCYPVQ